MFERPKNSKWMLPAICFVVLALLSLSGYAEGEGLFYDLSFYGFGLGALCLLSASVNLLIYAGDQGADILYKRRHALSLTPDGVMLEAVKGVHPETLKLVFGERQRAWMLKAGIEMEDGEPYAVMYARPDVTEMFIWHFLRNSSRYSCMAKNRLSDKAYTFDPLKKVTDYEQYDLFHSWLTQRGIATQAQGNIPALWLPPWEPKLVAEDLGWEWSYASDGLQELPAG